MNSLGLRAPRAPEDPRPDRTIADALLAVRLFADSLEPNTTVYQGLAAMDLLQAFRIVATDAEKDVNAARAEDRPQIKPLTRFRLTSTIADGLAQRIVPFGAASWRGSAASLGDFLRNEQNKGYLRKAAFGPNPPSPEDGSVFDTFFVGSVDYIANELRMWANSLVVAGLPSSLAPSGRSPTLLSRRESVDDLARRLKAGILGRMPRGRFIATAIDGDRFTDRLFQLTTGFLLDIAQQNYGLPRALDTAASPVRQNLNLLDVVRSINQGYGLELAPSMAAAESRLKFEWVDPGDVRINLPLLRVSWNTMMDVDWRGQLVVRGTMNLECGTREQADLIYKKFSEYCDPTTWSRSSAFWISSDRCNADGTPPVQHGGRHEHHERYDSGDPFFIREKVRGVTTYDVVLEVTYNTKALGSDQPFEVRALRDAPAKLYQADPGSTVNRTLFERTLTTYRLQDPLSTDLCKDEGYIEICLAQATGANQFFVQGEYVKILDFADSPYGGPGVTDLIAPSYVGSWVRVQLDLWASKAEGEIKDKLSIRGSLRASSA